MADENTYQQWRDQRIANANANGDGSVDDNQHDNQQHTDEPVSAGTSNTDPSSTP